MPIALLTNPRAAAKEIKQGRQAKSVPAPLSTTSIIVDGNDTLRPAMDFREDFGVFTVAVQVKVDGRHTWMPLAVTSGREIALVQDRHATFTKAGERVFQSQPLAMPSLARWKNSDVQRFAGGEVIAAADTFRTILALHEKYIDYPQHGAAQVRVLWAIGTYLYPLFPAYPYTENTAPRGSGKTKELRLTTMYAHNGRVIITPSEASTFRIIQDTHATIAFDEAESFNREQKDALLQILNSGYTAGGTVARCQDRTFNVVEYDVYSPTPPCIGDAVIWVAKLGGYLARKNDGPPGTLTLRRGWKRLADLTEGWQMAVQP